ncbi:MAG: hypothetical protein ATN35_06425 [Epulopiscium sp. Nele67-Bin004]|nr:MAG: hypothetical protein ATN35_06425 [Epulopiscium sp. Nele67-Bin004]
MVNTRNENVRKILQEAHQIMEEKYTPKIRQKNNEDFILENQIFSIVCEDIKISPSACAYEMSIRFKQTVDREDVIKIWKSRRLGNPKIRENVMAWVNEIVKYFGGAVNGDKKSFDKFEEARNRLIKDGYKKHDDPYRLLLLAIYHKYPEIDLFDDLSKIFQFGGIFSKYFFYDFADTISDVYGFVSLRNKKQNNKQNNKLSAAELEKRVIQLENMHKSTNDMLEELQEEFAVQLEESKVNEMTDFFGKLNSEKYGCLLDELLVIRKGVRKLRKENYELPIELSGVLIMVDKLTKFVQDNHIDPIMKIDDIKEVNLTDVEFCHYEGSPFDDAKETKIVRVVSPGWMYRDKEIQISRPRVKENI